LDFIYEAYNRYYPVPYKFCDSINLFNTYNSIKNELLKRDNISQAQLGQMFNQLICATKDDHSLVKFNTYFSLKRVLAPEHIYYDLNLINNSLIITKLYKKSKLNVGDIVLSINGISSDSLIKTYNSCIYYNNINIYDEKINTNLFATFYKRSKTIETTVKRNGQIIHEKKRRITQLKYSIRSNTWPKDAISITYPYRYSLYRNFTHVLSYSIGQTDSTLLNLNSSKMSFWISPDKNTGLLKINEFRSESNSTSLIIFFQKTFECMIENSTQNIIIDLRDNEGGFSYELQSMLKHMYKGDYQLFSKRIFKIDYIDSLQRNQLIADTNIVFLSNGQVEINSSNRLTAIKYGNILDFTKNDSIYTFKNIYILTNRESWSMSVIFSNSMKYNFSNCTIIGEPTLSNKSFCAGELNDLIFKDLILPYSGFFLNLPPCYHIPPDSDTEIKPLQPDIEVYGDEIDKKVMEIIKN